MTVWEQARIFAAMALCGASVGVAHDVLSMMRRGRALTACADILLGVLMAAGVIGTALVLQCDAFRLYVFLGVAAGWLLYAASLGTIVRILTERVGKLSKKAA